MKSIGTKLQELDDLVDVSDALDEWEAGFVKDMMLESHGGRETRRLTENQVEKIEQIWEAKCR